MTIICPSVIIDCKATPAIFSLSLHDALPISPRRPVDHHRQRQQVTRSTLPAVPQLEDLDRKSTRLNSSHPSNSYAVSCLKKNTSPNLTIHAPTNYQYNYFNNISLHVF